jgi:hypothetical protein
MNSTETIGEQGTQLLQPADSKTVRPVTIDGVVGSSVQQNIKTTWVLYIFDIDTMTINDDT